MNSPSSPGTSNNSTDSRSLNRITDVEFTAPPAQVNRSRGVRTHRPSNSLYDPTEHFRRITDAEITLPPEQLSPLTRGSRARRQSSSTYNTPTDSEPTGTSLKPSGIIPFSRDADFIQRSELFNQIRQKCAVASSRTALVGLGGVGKSQLAIEFAYQIREESPKVWVFWIHTSNAARFEQSFRNIAHRVTASRQNLDANVNIYQLVHDWLCDEKNGKWIIILDNADDISFLLEKNKKTSVPLVSYLPQCQNGSFLITSRSTDIAMKLVEQRDIVLVGPMGVSDASLLFKKKLGQQEECDDEEITTLVAGLEFMPLAIVQAAAYISQRRPRYSVQKYLKDFQKSDRRKTGLLDHEGGKLRRDWEANSSILTTWQISFDQIRHDRPSATDMLSLMSFYDRQGIPEVLLKNYTKRNPVQKEWDGLDSLDLGESDSDESTSEAKLGATFEDDLQILRNYSFISIAPDGKTFGMHRLVQLATRRWLDLHGQLEKWQHKAIRNILAELPIGEFENWKLCQILFPHAKLAAALPPVGRDALTDWSSLLYQAAWYAWRVGNGIDAEKMASQALVVKRRVLGEDHEETVDSMAMLGLAYNLRGEWDQAEQLQSQVMNLCKRKFGVGHPDTLTSMANLAATYWNQGRLDAAEQLEVEVMETRKRIFGISHPDTLACMSNLALTFKEQGRLDDAEKLGVQVMEMSNKLFGAAHPDTLNCMNNLAVTYWNQGKWIAAEKINTQVMETLIKTLGPSHPDTLTSMSNVAVTYWNQGRLDVAEQMELQVVNIRKKNFGVSHPDTLTSMANLALTYLSQGKWSLAETLGLDVMQTRKRSLGDSHPDTLDSMANLASTYRKQCRFGAAESLCLTVMETRKREFGSDYPGVLNIMATLALTYNDQGKLAEAEQLGLEIIQSRKEKLGADHPDTLVSIAVLVSTYRKQGRLEEAAHLGKQVMDKSKTRLGENHPDTLSIIDELSIVYRDQAKLDSAESLGLDVLQRKKEKLGPEHPDTLTSMHNLSVTYRELGRWNEAEVLEAGVLDQRKRTLGEEHTLTVASAIDLACIWKTQGRDNEAFAALKECVRLREEVMGKDHVQYVSAKRLLDGWEGEGGGSADTS